MKILKAFKLFSFYLGSLFLLCSSAKRPDQHVEPLTEFKGELRAERKPWLAWFLLFCSLQGRGFMFLYEALSKLG